MIVNLLPANSYTYVMIGATMIDEAHDQTITVVEAAPSLLDGIA